MTSAGNPFAGGGATGRLMGGLDWATTPLGPVSAWPSSLRSAVRLVLSSRYPMLLLWGDELSQLYNDAYAGLIGDKHPGALGRDVRETLAEGWDVLGPIIREVRRTGVASWVPALRLLLERAGYREEAYFSVSHAAVRDDRGDTVGVFTVCSEVTEQVVGERRLRLLRDLSVHGGRAPTVEHACAELVQAIGADPFDVPFAAVYLCAGDVALRTAAVGTDAAGRPVGAVLPDEVRLDGGASDPWGVRRAGSGAAVVCGTAGLVAVPAGPWGDPVRDTLAVPLPSTGPGRPLGVLLAAVSPNRALDEGYRSFFELLAQQVSVAVRNARAYAEERQRAEALAELDRVKTGFFTNVSHEFRTPLTLMLGPLADALDDSRDPLSEGQRARVDMAWRNATRLRTLVNDLLTFAGLEAGRAARHPRVVDLPALTAEVASVFRAAVERAGLRLVVRCPPLPRPVAVDPDNWETVVTNLLSNALKFTFVGEIRVTLDAGDDGVRLAVADTGIGIAPDDLDRLFERFHRVHGARSRSHEGTGIGLALVRELVRLQGGDVGVSSEVGAGTRFTVFLPWSALDPGAAPAGTDGGGHDTARAGAREAMGWLADAGGTGPPAAVDAGDDLTGTWILVADDNSDMRAYLARLLRGQGWQVETVGNGRAALDAVRRRRPDLVLTDVMMPELDGFQLLRALRRDDATRTVPVVVLSARAGGEASVEGLDLGADDYVVKPFNATELVARLRAALRGAAGRRDGPDGGGGRGDGGDGDRPAAPPDRAAPATAPNPTTVPVARDAAPEAGAAPVADLDREWVYPSTPRSPAAARRDVGAVLRDSGVDDDIVEELLIALSEAVNNAVEHAQDPARAEVEVRLQVAAGSARISVRDFGRWRSRRPAMDRGRGAALMTAYADVSVRSTPGGTTVVLERRLSSRPAGARAGGGQAG